MSVKEYILVLSIEGKVNVEDIVNKVTGYVRSIQGQLTLHPPSNIINKEKRETLRNLYASGYEEEVIADQLDLALSTMRVLEKEIHPVKV
jgi:hypothetical protein